MKIRFHWGILAIFVLAVFLRFVNFPNRWGLGYDQASFAIVGKHAASAADLDRAHWAYLDFPVVYKSVQHWW